MTALPAMLLSFLNGDDLRSRIFFDKYALRNEEGKVIEETPVEMWKRVAWWLSQAEKTDQLRQYYYNEFYWLLENFRFIPGGRILHAVGNPRRVTALNCYVIPIKDDSLESIFGWMTEAARTYSFGGGVGTDISILRPRGTPVNNVARTSTGSVSFMDLMSLTTGTIGQAGRRGALMITIADSHPDVLDFIKVKRNQDKVRYANISIRVSDTFMNAVENDSQDWLLSFENEKIHFQYSIRARDLWKELIYGARNFAEPGLIFWDNIKKYSTSEYNGMNVHTVNPCAEISLEPYGCCCLGNINLSQFVVDEFNESIPSHSNIHWRDLDRALRLAVRFLDNVLDYNANKHPLIQQKETSLFSRRIGVGFTGLGDMLCQLRIQYDSDEALDFADRLFCRMKNVVYDESSKLAIEKGTFPGYTKKHLDSIFLHSLDYPIIDRINKTGLRNVALLTIPPVGTGAALAGTTSGIEPIFDLSYHRRSESLSQSDFEVYHPLVARYKAKRNGKLPHYFVTAHIIKPDMRVKMQSIIQRHIDHSISSTVNLPESATEDDVSNIYFQAWKAGAKGITVYRENSRQNILTSSSVLVNTNSVCSECGSELIHENGCSVCRNCGVAACSL